MLIKRARCRDSWRTHARGGSDLPEATWPHVASAAYGGAGSPFLSHTHSADHRRVPEPRAGVATYFFSASVEGSSNLSPKANEERLPWTSPETAFLAEVGSSRPGMGAKTLQGRQGGEGALSGGTARGEGVRARKPSGSATTRQGSGSEKNGCWSFSSRGGWREDPWDPRLPGAQLPWLLFTAGPALSPVSATSVRPVLTTGQVGQGGSAGQAEERGTEAQQVGPMHRVKG